MSVDVSVKQDDSQACDPGKLIGADWSVETISGEGVRVNNITNLAFQYDMILVRIYYFLAVRKRYFYIWDLIR